MKRARNYLAIILLAVTAGCGGGKQSTDDIITVDVTKHYPKKELTLQDIFDVEYIALDTNEEFITAGLIDCISKDIIIVKNSSMCLDGDILVFDRNGKGLRKINRKGQGPEEYIAASYITIDEENDEMIITDLFGQNYKVYDLFGNFKLSLKNSRNIQGYGGVFDQEHLICCKLSGDFVNGKMEGLINEFFIISRKEGCITKEIDIPFKEKKWPNLVSPDGSRPSPSPGNLKLIPYKNNWAITEISSDTIYSVMPDYSLAPLIVRTPSIQSMDPEVYLFLSVISDRYYFMQTVKREYNFSMRTGWPSIELMYDRQECAIFECVVYNNDFLNKRPVIMNFENRFLANTFHNNEIAFFNILQSHELVNSYRNGELKEGRLKEIAARLDEEDNLVIMIAKHRK